VIRGALVLAALAACQPMYGDKAQPLANPTKHPAPPTPAGADQPKYIEDCPVSFSGNPKGVYLKRDRARELATSANLAVERAAQVHDARQGTDLFIDALDKYRSALLDDPYNADATLGLARSYDRLYRKGCALAMLRRLAGLTKNTKLAPDASEKIADVVDNPSWFKAYRKDALAALGH
jgi:hypothetical protein